MQEEFPAQKVLDRDHSVCAEEAASGVASKKAPEVTSSATISERPEQDMESSDQVSLEALKLTLVEREKEYAHQLLRHTADLENTKRRMQQQHEKQKKFLLEGLLSDLLPVVDNLERALGSSNVSETKGDAGLYEGVQLTLEGFISILKQYGIAAIEEKGILFDPSIHQAMLTVQEEKEPPNQVVSVLQKGYRLHERLLRPALVTVNRPTN